MSFEKLRKTLGEKIGKPFAKNLKQSFDDKPLKTTTVLGAAALGAAGLATSALESKHDDGLFAPQGVAVTERPDTTEVQSDDGAEVITVKMEGEEPRTFRKPAGK